MSLQGDLHGSLDANADTRHRDYMEILRDLELEDIHSTSDFMKDVKRMKNKFQRPIRFSTLSKTEKQEDRKELEKLKWKASIMISKAKGTAKSLREAAGKLDEVWTSSKTAKAVGTAGSITGGLLAIAGGIATVITGGAASPLLMAGVGISLAGAGANLATEFKEASIKSSEIKRAEEMLQDTKDSIDDVSDTIHEWLESKDEVHLFYICCLAELDPDKNDLVIKLLRMVLLPSIMHPAVNVSGRRKMRASSARMSRDKVAAELGLKAGEHAVYVGTKVAARVGSKLTIGVTAALVLWEAIDLGYTIKDIVQDKGSEAARCLRQKADKLECFQKSFKDQ